MRAAAVGTLALTMSVATALSVAATTVRHRQKLTLLQQGQAFYRGKTITFIATTTAGSGNDRNSRAVTQVLGQELGATVNVEDIGAGSGIAGGDVLAASNPNGLTIGYFNPGTEYYDLVTNVAGYNFNPERMTFLGGIVDGYNILTTQATSAYSNFGALINAAANGGASLLVVGGNSALEAQVIMKSFGIHVKVISGYASSSATVAGLLRGDGQLINISWANISSEVVAGVARPIAISISAPSMSKSYPAYGSLAAFPTIGALEKQYPAKTSLEKQARADLAAFYNIVSFTASAPTKTPSAEVRALQWAMKKAITSNYVKATLTAQGLPTGFVSPETLKANYVTALKSLSRLQSLLAS